MTAETPEQIFARVMGEHIAREEAERRYRELLDPTAAHAGARTGLSLGAPRARRTVANNNDITNTDNNDITDEGARRSSLALR